ncbi:unnamed protein product [Cylicostephanus goldi]|uniref:Uncharacterized protein n=1 Tax=Cylicostephanus goldi TaxID=71465 RepID=A0A3P7NC39_CYLGO|nr:unnamed protein product [Cylicostephanus goldi]
MIASERTLYTFECSGLFGKRDKHRQDTTSFNPSEEHSQSCDIIGGESFSFLESLGDNREYF